MMKSSLRVLCGVLNIEIKCGKGQQLAIKIISYLYTLTSTIPHCRFIEVPQR